MSNMESARNEIRTYSSAGFRYLGTGISYINPSGIMGSVRNGVGTYSSAGFRYLGTGISYINPSGIMGSVRSGVGTYSSAGLGYLGTGISYINPSGVLGSVCNGVSSYSVAGYRYLGIGISYINPSGILGPVRNGGLMALDMLRDKRHMEKLQYFHSACMILDLYPGTGFRQLINITILTASFIQKQNSNTCPSLLPKDNHEEMEVGAD